MDEEEKKKRISFEWACMHNTMEALYLGIFLEIQHESQPSNIDNVAKIHKSIVWQIMRTQLKRKDVLISINECLMHIYMYTLIHIIASDWELGV